MTPRTGRKRRRGRAGLGRREKRGQGFGHDRSADRKKRLLLTGIPVVKVSDARLDVEGLENNWLGRAIPGLTKEGVVRACMSPRQETLSAASSEPPHAALRFDRHLSFVEFHNGYALLMNCLGSVAREREQASGFLNEDGSYVAWFLQGRLAPERIATEAGGKARSNAVGRFFERLEVSSGASSSIWGALPNDCGNAHDAANLNAASRAYGEVVAAGTSRASSATNLDLVLFARSKGRPFVYCGAVECVAQEYAWNTGSSRLGAVRFILALRDWRRASARTAPGGEDDGDGEGAPSFGQVVREGLKSESSPNRF